MTHPECNTTVICWRKLRMKTVWEPLPTTENETLQFVCRRKLHQYNSSEIEWDFSVFIKSLFITGELPKGLWSQDSWRSNGVGQLSEACLVSHTRFACNQDGQLKTLQETAVGSIVCAGVIQSVIGKVLFGTTISLALMIMIIFYCEFRIRPWLMAMILSSLLTFSQLTTCELNMLRIYMEFNINCIWSIQLTPKPKPTWKPKPKS